MKKKKKKIVINKDTILDPSTNPCTFFFMSDIIDDTDLLSTDSSPSNSATAALSAEIKSLRGQLMALKKSVTRGDKKQKRAIEEEVQKLEQLIESKQALKSALSEASPVQEESAAAAAAAAADDSNALEAKRATSRDRKERRQKEKEATHAAIRLAALTAASQRPDLAAHEAAAFARRLQERGFEVLEVAADGHCLFGAVGCQLPQVRDHWWVRGVAADWMLSHAEAFAPFLELDGCASFEEYCGAVRGTGQWGGQLELEALAQALPARICVVQAEGEDLWFGGGGGGDGREGREGAEGRDTAKSTEDTSGDIVIYLSYHRHAFSLGEHYNALIKKREGE